MRTWSYGINSYKKKGHISLDEAPWYIFFLDTIVTFICDKIPEIPLPRIPFRLNEDEMRDNNGNEFTNWREWFGDWSQLFHVFVHMPVFDFCWKHTDSKCIPVPYGKLKKLFYEDDEEWWDEEEVMGEEMRQEDIKGKSNE